MKCLTYSHMGGIPSCYYYNLGLQVVTTQLNSSNTHQGRRLSTQLRTRMTSKVPNSCPCSRRGYKSSKEAHLRNYIQLSAPKHQRLKMQSPPSVKGITLALVFTASSSLFTTATSQPVSTESSSQQTTIEKRSLDGCRLTVSVLAPGDLTMDFANRFGADPENVRTPDMARSVQLMKDAIADGDQVRAHDALYTNCQASVRDDASKHNTGRQP
ncbi:hypothetical protein L249_8680 [Ophiocordyceps polyrhachis-furcata BCC 54312]|uniref:Uncharacterized protein n=1 Tax=Ophiocordyceps polyrhachis-furcata BCC 54312 TaxID=1330021 RepID=A0A367L712_9HYPO|nr:hypothetical protein L249_8680 [Ophiocordyceps polyrhachis-furcata BCC 54312]